MSGGRPSLLRHLLAWSLGTVLLVWSSFVLIGFQTGGHEADELTDGHLASVASLMLTQRLAASGAAAPDAALLGGRAELKAHDYQQSLSIVEWAADGRLLVRIGAAPLPPFSAGEGFETLQLGTPATAWRAFSRWDRPRHNRRITVLLSLAERDALADDIAAQVAMPGLWLLPVVGLVLTVAVRRGLRPLLDLSRQVSELDVHRQVSLHGPPHQEFSPVVHSINTLVARYNAALERERALASEVAHELRTPLTSLSLHAAALQGTCDKAECDQALRRIDHDAKRAGHVLTQLLSLARASRAELAEAAQPLDMADLARAVAAEYGQAAHASGHQLSVDALPCSIDGHPLLLAIGLRNLIDNALAHTPPGTRVQVRVTDGPPTLAVCDDGRSRSGNPRGGAPDRSAGLGLGLQVVRRVAAVHDGQLEIAEGSDGATTCYRVVLAAAARPA